MLSIYNIIEQEKESLNNTKILYEILEDKRVMDIETIKYIRNLLYEYTDDKDIREDINWILIISEWLLNDLFI